MSHSATPDFSKFVPGFDFLQSLTQGKSNPMPGPAAWVAPTLDPKELDKRIEELKAVQFWLDQNATALKATIQALEVQKMTLATLQGMNMDMSAMSKAFQFPATAKATSTNTSTATGTAKEKRADAPPTPAVDPIQLWTSLTHQFQQIASNAMQEVVKQSAKAPDVATKAGTERADSKKSSAKKTVKKSAKRS